jgi:hypothetical protein
MGVEKKKKRKCTMVSWEGALAIGVRTIATMVIMANAFNIDHPNYVLRNVCALVDKNLKPSIQIKGMHYILPI